jgi:hypothetical protein
MGSSSGWILEHIKSSLDITICILILICSKGQPDDELVDSKYVAVWIPYKVVFYGHLVIPYFLVIQERDSW